jgi:hypothetical protein
VPQASGRGAGGGVCGRGGGRARGHTHLRELSQVYLPLRESTALKPRAPAREVGVNGGHAPTASVQQVGRRGGAPKHHAPLLVRGFLRLQPCAPNSAARGNGQDRAGHKGPCGDGGAGLWTHTRQGAHCAARKSGPQQQPPQAGQKGQQTLATRAHTTLQRAARTKRHHPWQALGRQGAEQALDFSRARVRRFGAQLLKGSQEVLVLQLEHVGDRHAWGTGGKKGDARHAQVQRTGARHPPGRKLSTRGIRATKVVQAARDEWWVWEQTSPPPPPHTKEV